MIITKRQLRRLIKEEKTKLMSEAAMHTRKSLEAELTVMGERLSEIANDFDEGMHADTEQGGYEEYDAQDLYHVLQQASVSVYDILKAYGVSVVGLPR